jgi:hypothetical protein
MRKGRRVELLDPISNYWILITRADQIAGLLIAMRPRRSCPLRVVDQIDVEDPAAVTPRAVTA